MKKFGILCLAIVLALGTIGVGYASWSDTIYIGGSVNTGNLCCHYVPPAFTLDDPLDATGAPVVSYDWTCDPVTMGNRHVYGTQEGENDDWKDVGSSTATINGEDDHIVDVVLENVYPCYFTTVTTHIQNCGSIPVKLQEPTLTYPDPYNPEQFITVALPKGEITYIPGEDQYGGISDVLQIIWVDNIGTQIDEPPDEAEDSFHIHVLQAAKPDFTYTFTISRVCIQWDEYSANGAGGQTPPTTLPPTSPPPTSPPPTSPSPTPTRTPPA
jgi:hypothetical protein